MCRREDCASGTRHRSRGKGKRENGIRRGKMGRKHRPETGRERVRFKGKQGQAADKKEENEEEAGIQVSVGMCSIA